MVTEQLDVKAGYKQTEVGIIPDDWKLTTIGEEYQISAGSTPKTNEKKFFKGNIPWVTSTDLNRGIVVSSTALISGEAVKKTNLKVYPKGSFVIAAIGVDAEYTRGNCGILDMDATINQVCVGFKKSVSVNTNYFFYFYLLNGNNLIFKFHQGTKQWAFYPYIIRKIPFVLPPLPEQEIIATTLSNIDELVNQLGKVIDKKKNIKQGTMQELLTGKRRLRGFDDKWNTKRLGKLADMSSGGTPLTNVNSYYGGKIPWVVISDMTNSGKYIRNTGKNITEKGLENSSTKIFKRGTLFFAMYASIGKCCISKIDLSCNQGILGIKTKDIDTEFLYYVMVFSKEHFLNMGQTGTQSNLNKGIVQNLDILYPSNKEEQKAIAQILSDMDSEIKELETKRDKYIMIKNGMMQKLLTGEIRLT